MRHISLLFLCLLLQACTHTQRNLSDALTSAISGPEDVTISDEQIRRIPYASMYVRIDNGQRLFVVLGYNEYGQQKWLTRDSAMLVTVHGRLVKTLGLSDNLLNVSNLQNDPLQHPLNIDEGKQWTRNISWTEKGQLRSGFAVSRFTREPDENILIGERQIACRVYREDVKIEATGKRWENRFLVDAATGQLRQTHQMLGADYLPVETTLLKPAKS